MASSKLITFYVSQVLIPIMDRLNELKLEEFNEFIQTESLFRRFCFKRQAVTFTKEEVDTLLKAIANIDMSKIQMSNEELNGLILESFQFGDRIGLSLDYPQDYLDKLIKLNIK